MNKRFALLFTAMLAAGGYAAYSQSNDNTTEKTVVILNTDSTTSAFTAVSSNDKAKPKVEVNNGLTNYTSAVPGNAGDVGTHTGESGSIGMVVFGPP